jgi:hypothetical protein
VPSRKSGMCKASCMCGGVMCGSGDEHVHVHEGGSTLSVRLPRRHELSSESEKRPDPRVRRRNELTSRSDDPPSDKRGRSCRKEPILETSVLDVRAAGGCPPPSLQVLSLVLLLPP